MHSPPTKSLQPSRSDSTGNWTLARLVTASLLLTVLSLVFAGCDSAAILCFAIAILTMLSLTVRAAGKRGTPLVTSLVTLAACLLVSALLLTNYTLVRDHIRWLFLSGVYKARALAQPVSTNGELKHTEWDVWGFVGSDTTVFLVFDPTNSLAGALRARPPVKARGLPCEVVRVRRLESQWYAVLFYTETYWGQGNCGERGLN